MSDRKAPFLLACATVICVAALYVRRPHVSHLPQFYAEEVVRSGNRFAMIAFAAGLPLFVATLVSYGRHPALPSAFANAIRNFYLPMVFLLWSLIAATRFDARRVAAWVVAFAWFAVQIPFIPETRKMPDLRWEKHAERIPAGEYMKIPITPAGWTMTLQDKRDRPPQ